LSFRIDPRIPDVGRALTAGDITWAVAGGWAIDAFLGRVTREHADIDIAVWRGDQSRMRSALAPDWQFEIIEDGQRRPWRVGETLLPPIHEIHAHRAGLPQSTLEFLLNDHDTSTWIYRRDTAVRLAIDRTILRRDAVPFLAPEIVLVYKSKDPRPHDDMDLRAALPAMTSRQRLWLRDAIARATGAHPWLDLIDAPET
jgi:hypothetical protein